MARQSTQPTPPELTSNDLPLLLNTLNPIASKCFALGLQWGLTYPQMRKIEDNYGKSEDQLREIISERLRQEQPLTWPDIVRALRAESVGENRLASELEHKYIHHMHPPTSVAPPTKADSLATSFLQSSLPTSQCNISPLAQGESLCVRPLSPSSVLYQHTYNSTQLMAPSTHCLTPLDPVLSAHSSVCTQANSSSDVQGVVPAMHHLSVSGSKYPPLSASSPRVASTPSEYDTSIASYQPSALDVINRHSTALTIAIGNDVPFFSNKFIELGFITRVAADDIHSKLGIGSQEKGLQLLNLVVAHYHISREKMKWLDKFVAVFSCEAAYADIATSMIEDIRRCEDCPSTSPEYPATQLTASQPPVPVHSQHNVTYDPVTETYTMASHIAYPPLTNQPSMQPHMIPHPPAMWFPPHYPSQQCVIQPQPAQTLNMQPSNSSQANCGYPHPLHMSSYQIPLHLTRLPNTYQPYPAASHDIKLHEGIAGRRWIAHSHGDHTQVHTAHSEPLTHPELHRSAPRQLQDKDAMGDKFQIFIDYVKTLYRASEVESHTTVVKWPPTPSTAIINLACINRKSVSVKSREYNAITKAMICDGNVDVINTTKGPIEFDEIAEGIPIPSSEHSDIQATVSSREKRLILVEGAPGVGKSTFAWEFCRRWARGELAQQYKLVLLLRLRDDRMSKANSLDDLICHPLKGVSEAVSAELILSHHLNALIILEGFDELPDSCRGRQSIFCQLMAGTVLPLATVLVTSRPWATQAIHSDCDISAY